MDASVVGPSGWYHLIFFGLFLPVAAVRSRLRLASGTAIPSLRQYFRSGLMTQLIFLTVSLVVARFEWIELFPRRLPSPAGVVAGAVMLGGSVALMRPRWRRAVEARKPIVRLFMPRDRTERRYWIALSTLAGIGEEITWRGVQFVLLTRLTGAPIAAAAICSMLFGIGHIVQGWQSAAIIAGIAAGCHTIAWLSGSLYVVMAVHALYDITAGLSYGRLGRELGYDAGGIESRA